MSDQQDATSIPVLYTNSIRLAISFSDFRIFIGEAIPIGPSPNLAAGGLLPAQGVQNVDRVCVVVSPDLIPQLIAGLETGIKNYEQTFGPLRKNPQGPQPGAVAETTAS